MILHEWEIWHTYSTHLDTRIDGLDSAGRALVEAGIALCSMHRDGRTYWYSNAEVQSGWTKVNLNAQGNEASIQLIPDNGETATFAEFSKEAWLQAARFRFSEMRVFGEAHPLLPPYVRAYLGQWNLASKIREEIRLTLCYPVVKIYDSGVVLVELRIISSGTPIETKDFIEEYVNLHKEHFNRVDVQPGMAKIAPRAYYHYMRRHWPFYRRAGLLYFQKRHDKEIARLITVDNEGDFSFELAPLTSSDEDTQYDTLSSLALTLVHTIAYILSKPRTGASFLIRGQKRLIQMGDSLWGRPHIYLCRFENQMDTSLDNENHYREDLGWILARTWGAGFGRGARYLPANSRAFEDFGAYITSAATLWVWAKKGIRNQEQWADLNRGHLIYEHQAVAEFLEYAYRLHLSFFERTIRYAKPERVLEARRHLTILKHQMAEVSHYGEIQDLLQHGWESMGISELQNRISESLSIREAETALVESRSTALKARMLTVLFGLVAVPPISTEVVKPLFDYCSLWRPDDPSAAKLLMVLVALGVVFVALGTVFFGYKCINWFRHSKD